MKWTTDVPTVAGLYLFYGDVIASVAKTLLANISEPHVIKAYIPYEGAPLWFRVFGKDDCCLLEADNFTENSFFSSQPINIPEPEEA